MLYRQRLQVERDLRAGAMAGDAVVGAETPGVRRDGPLGASRTSAGSSGPAPRRSWRPPRTSARSRRSIGWPGSEWRWAARAASVAVHGGQGGHPAPADDADEAPNGAASAPPPRTAEALDAPRRSTAEPAATRRRGRRSGALGHLVELPAGQARRRGHPFRGLSPGRARVHERLDLGDAPPPAHPRAEAAAAGVRCRSVAVPHASRRRARTRRGSGSCPPRRPSPARRACPRTICSCTLVSSRQTAPARPAPQAAARSRSVAATRPGASNSTDPRSSAAIAGQSVLSFPPGARQEPLERPARPGHPGCGHRGEHGRGPGDRHDPAPLPRPRRDEVRAGIADDRRAGIGDEREVRAAAQVLQERASRPGPLRAWKLVIRPDSPCRSSSRLLSRVSSAAISGTAARTSSARNVTSARFPIGVATTYSTPRRADRERHRPTWASPPASRLRVTPAPTPAAGAGTGSRRPPSAARAWRSAAPGA